MRAIQERLRKWVKKYAAKVFVVTLSDAEVDAIVSEIMSTYGTPVSP
jgi:selenophosphate synthetase-related protein